MQQADCKSVSTPIRLSAPFHQLQNSNLYCVLRMSGFEIVGVILGAIPLLISAIEKYKATSQRLKYFKYKEPYIAQLIQSLEDQKFFLESDLYIPLNSTNLEEDQINNVIRQANPDLFRDIEISQALREYLGDGYAPYQRAVTRCHQILVEIASNINGLASTAKV